MKTILTYDTETTGLPLWNLPSEHPEQPRVIQLAADLSIEETGESLASMSVIIRPDGWTIPHEIQVMTGITMDLAHAIGIPAKVAIDTFTALWMAADQRCAHNESFDMRMLRIEYMRHEQYSGEMIPTNEGTVPFADYWKAAPAFCTQGNSVKIINLPPTAKMLAARRKGPKSPNLAEAYEFFTGKKLEGAHNALVDVQACKAVYYGIKAHNAQVPA